MKTTAQIADEVYELLSDEDNWTKGALARDRDGNEVAAVDPDATCYCLAGALIKVLNRDPIQQGSWAIHRIFSQAWKEHVNPCGMSYVNDTYGRQAVLAGLEKLREAR